MSLPDLPRMFAVLEATWPAARVWRDGPFALREGLGGGSRVSAATCEAPFAPADIDAAARAMREAGQPALFMVRTGEGDLDRALAAAGYLVKDPVVLYAAPVAGLTGPGAGRAVWPPSHKAVAIWAEGGIGAGRIAVMARVSGPKTAVEAPDGVLFAGIEGDVAMLHAIEVRAAARRRGIARGLMMAAANWAAAQGAATVSLVVTERNVAARALYASLGMAPVGHYHYRIEPEADHGH